MSATTVQRIRAILRSALKTAEQWGYVERNSARLADPPRSVRREADFLAVPEVTRLLEFTSDIRAHRLGPLFAFAVATGLRQGELLALTWPQVDLERKTLKVRHTLQKHGKGHWEFAEPKSAAGRRDIPLPEVAIAALRSQQENIREMRILAGADWQESMLVFPSMRGTPLDGSNVTTRFKATLAAAGLRKVRFHDLRHTCGTYLIAQGVSPRTVMAILGHSQISLTLGTYSHATPEMLRDAADAMDKVLVMAPRPARGAAPG